MRLLTTLLFLCSLLSPIPAAFAEGNDAKDITLSLDNADITDLIRWASEVTDKNIILHPNVQGRVTVISGEPMSKSEAYQAFLSILQVHGLTVVGENDVLKVIPDAKAKESSIPLAAESNGQSAEDVVVRIVKLNNIPASTLISLIQPLVPQTGYMAAYPQTNTLMIADRTANIAKVMQVINRLDQASTVEIEMIALKYGDAKEVVNVLNSLLPKQGDPNMNLNLAVDERSNSVLLTGDPVTRQQIRLLMNKLDQPLEKNGNTQVFRIQYATAKDLLPIIESFTSKSGGKSAGGAEADFSIQVHEQLNALIITAPPPLMKTIRGVVDQLDVPRSQVLVEALIVEVSEDLAHNLGVEWQSNQPGQEGSATFGGFRDFPADVTPLSVTNGVATLGTGLSLGYFRNGSLRGIINALEGETSANILSTPTIVSLDNEEAEILVGSNVPFITGSQQRAGDIDPFQTIQRQDIGVTLKVKPRINNNDSVTLDIEQTVESIAPSTASTADIVTNKREIKTRVLIGNDDVLVLGGLMRDEVTNGENRVPVLGRIPVLGRLFKSTTAKNTKTNLMVFIHPRILEDTNTLRTISTDRYNQLRNRQLQFNDNGFSFWVPGTAPVLPALPEGNSPEPGAPAEPH